MSSTTALRLVINQLLEDAYLLTAPESSTSLSKGTSTCDNGGNRTVDELGIVYHGCVLDNGEVRDGGIVRLSVNNPSKIGYTEYSITQGGLSVMIDNHFTTTLSLPLVSLSLKNFSNAIIDGDISYQMSLSGELTYNVQSTTPLLNGSLNYQFNTSRFTCIFNDFSPQTASFTDWSGNCNPSITS